MKKRMSCLLVAWIMGLALLASGGCCHMGRHHGDRGSCCEPCCEKSSPCGCQQAPCNQPQKPCNTVDCPKKDVKN